LIVNFFVIKMNSIFNRRGVHEDYGSDIIILFKIGAQEEIGIFVPESLYINYDAVLDNKISRNFWLDNLNGFRYDGTRLGKDNTIT